jgi:hypothetical protein
MKKLIRKILREEIEKSDRHYRRLDIISDHVQLPYFESMEGLTIYEHGDQEYIMRKILGNITIKGSSIYNDKGKQIYWENNLGYWKKWEYDDKGNQIYSEDSDGNWEKREFHETMGIIKRESSDGYWQKWEYDDNGNKIYFENNRGDWVKREYDDNGNQTYYENSYGEIIDRR